jgi:hypothetical protein
MRNSTELLFVGALIVGIVAAGIYIGSHMSANCYDFWPFKGSACVVTTK